MSRIVAALAGARASGLRRVKRSDSARFLSQESGLGSSVAARVGNARVVHRWRRADAAQARRAGRTFVAARSAVGAVHLHVPASTRTGGGRRGASTLPVRAGRPTGAHQIAAAAVVGVVLRVHARAAAIDAWCGARRSARVVVTHLRRAARRPAGAAVGGVALQVDADTAAVGEPSGHSAGCSQSVESTIGVVPTAPSDVST